MTEIVVLGTLTVGKLLARLVRGRWPTAEMAAAKVLSVVGETAVLFSETVPATVAGALVRAGRADGSLRDAETRLANSCSAGTTGSEASGNLSARANALSRRR
jgi:hypothetical protein